MTIIIVKILLQTFLIQYHIHPFAIATKNDIPSGQVKPLRPSTVNHTNKPNTVTSAEKQISHKENLTPLTQVLYRSWNDNKVATIDLGKQNFEKFLQESFLIVDKSKLLSFLFRQGGGLNLITAPRCWGKSTNLNMINFFVARQYNKDGEMIEPTETDAYAYFKEGKIRYFDGVQMRNASFNKAPLISNDKDIINHHLARYVTVRLDFGIVNVKDENDTVSTKVFYDSFKEAISNAYTSVGYLNGILQKKINQETDEHVAKRMKDYHNKYWAFIREEEDSCDELLSSMNSLFEIICEYVNKDEVLETNRLIFLFDEYDKPLNDLYLSQKLDVESAEAKRISTFLSRFFFDTFKMSIPYITVVTGIMRISFSDGAFSTCNKFIHRGLGSTSCFYPFYGYTEEEVTDLLKVKGLNDHYDDVKKRYKGYYKISSPNKCMFNPWDIMNYVKSGILKSYWCETDQMATVVDSLLKHHQIRSIFIKLLSLQENFTLEEELFHIDAYKDVGRIIRSYKWVYLYPSQLEYVMSYFLRSGYVTLVDYNRGTISVALPNEEVAMYIQNSINVSLCNLFNEKPPEMLEAAESCLRFLNNDDEPSKKTFQDNIVRVINSHISKKFLDELNSTDSMDWKPFGFVQLNEASLRSLVHKILSFVQLQEEINLALLLGFKAHIPSEGTKSVRQIPDLFAYHKNRALVVELKCSCAVPVQKVLDQALGYTPIFQNLNKRFDVVKYVAINLCMEKGKEKEPVKIDFVTDLKKGEEIDSYIKELLTTSKTVVVEADKQRADKIA